MEGAKRFIGFATIVLLSLMLLQMTSTSVEAYTVSFNFELAKKTIKELPYNWYYSFDSYSSTISAGITAARDDQISQFYTPSNASGVLIDNAMEVYYELIKKLDEGDIKSACYELGKLVSYLSYLSNPFRTTDLKNITLAQRLESLILAEDLREVTINKNIQITDVKNALAEIGLKAISFSSILNKTSLIGNKRDKSFTSFVKEMFSYSASVLYSILMKAIKEHEANSINKNITYIAVLSSIIAVSILIANRKKLKHLERKIS